MEWAVQKHRLSVHTYDRGCGRDGVWGNGDGGEGDGVHLGRRRGERVGRGEGREMGREGEGRSVDSRSPSHWRVATCVKFTGCVLAVQAV